MKRTYLALFLCSLAFAQSPPPKPAFEVASIKPLAPAAATERMTRKVIDDSQVSLGSVTLATVVQLAYRVTWDQVVGLDTITQQRFDLQATLPPGSSKNDVPEMLQTLLAERFRLVIHHDQKTVPVYSLTVGKDGPNFHESMDSDSASPGCMGGLHKVCHKAPMDDLVNILTLPFHAGMGAGWAIDRLVVDMTGLKGKYDFSFDYGRDGAPDASATDSDLFTAFDAVKALGLKLEPTKQAYDLIVIDRIERLPTEN